MTHVTRIGEWLHAEVAGDRMMMNTTTGAYLGLSTVGARIWDLLEQPRSFESLCAELVGLYAVDPETCRTEVQAFLAELRAIGAVRFDPPA